MPSTISHMSSSTFVLNDRIFVLGGETDHNAATRSVLAYDPASNTWDVLTPLPGDRFSGVARAMEGVLYFTGGSNTSTTYRGVFTTNPSATTAYQSASAQFHRAALELSCV